MTKIRNLFFESKEPGIYLKDQRLRFKTAELTVSAGVCIYCFVYGSENYSEEIEYINNIMHNNNSNIIGTFQN